MTTPEAAKAQEREVFETWYAPIFKGGHRANMPRRKNGEYVSAQDQIAWMSFQAARAALTQEAGPWEGVESVRRHLAEGHPAIDRALADLRGLLDVAQAAPEAAQAEDLSYLWAFWERQGKPFSEEEKAEFIRWRTAHPAPADNAREPAQAEHPALAVVRELVDVQGLIEQFGIIGFNKDQTRIARRLAAWAAARKLAGME